MVPVVSAMRREDRDIGTIRQDGDTGSSMYVLQMVWPSVGGSGASDTCTRYAPVCR